MKTHLIYTIVMATAYLLSGILSLGVYNENSLVTMSAFFPEGFALAGALLYGRRVLLGIFIGQLLLAIYSHFPLQAGIGIAFINTFEAYIAYKLFSYFKLNSHMQTLKDLFGLFFLILFVLQPMSAVLGNFVLYYEHIIPLDKFIYSAFYWWMGNVLGQILLTPILLLVYYNSHEINIKSIIGVILSTIFFNYIFQVYLAIDNTSLLLIVTLPATIYLTTINITYASISSVLLATISLFFAQNNMGTFSHGPSHIHNILDLNYFMASHVLLVLLVGILFKEKKSAIHTLKSMAHYDYLTGLPNRHLLRQSIHNSLYISRVEKEASAICFLDFDGFKPINDTLGHHIGDEVLKEAVERINTCITDDDAFLRIGGDEFLLIYNHITSKNSIEKKLNHLLSSIREPMHIESHQIQTSLSIGVALCPAHGTTVEELMSKADAAMYVAKRNGKDQFHFA